MIDAFKAIFGAIILVLSFAISTAAGPLEDGNAAYKRRDYATAMRILRPLADQGNGMAATIVGLMYYFNYGVPQDYVTAHMWFNLGAAHGNSLGAFFLKTVSDQMTPAQIAEAQRLARDWKPRSSKVARGDDKGSLPHAPGNKVTSTGSGFFVSKIGHIVTNAHVVDGCQTVRSSHGGSLRKVSTDEESDLALYIASEKPDVIARLQGGRGALAGESVVAVGFPLSGLLSSDPIVTTGIISALSGLRNDRRTVQITAPVQPGNSGGPLLGENGSVVGVVVGKLNAMKVAEEIGDIPQNVNFAVSLGTLQSFLNANDVPYELDDSKTLKMPTDIVAEATRYTVLLECLTVR